MLCMSLSCTKNTDVSKIQANYFVKYFGGSATDKAMDMILCTDGGYAMTGTLATSSSVIPAIFIKTDQYGNEVNYSPIYPCNGNNSIGNSVCQTSDGNFTVVGSVSVLGRTDKDIFVSTINKNGTFALPKIYGGLKDDEGLSVIQVASDKSLLIGGYTESSGHGGKDAYGLCLDSLGNKKWEQTYGFLADEVANSFIDKGSYFLLVGYTESFQFSTSGRSVFLVKVDKLTGNALDFVYYGGINNETGVKAVVDNTGDIYVLANSESAGLSNIYLLRLKDDFHQMVWEKYVTSANNEVGNDILLKNGQLIVIGTSTANQNSDYLIDIFDTDGTLLNAGRNTISALGNQFGQSGVIGADGKIVIAGSNIDRTGGFSKIALIKTDLPQ
jgi:hypothetical protein